MCEKKYTQEELTDAFRSAIEDRAKWFYLLLRYGKEQGVDPDLLSQKAIKEFGNMKASAIGEVQTPVDFAKAILSGHANKAFAMESVKMEEKECIIKFRHCALVEAWKKLGCTPEEIAELCRLASYGDFGMIEKFPHLNLRFDHLLSKGHDCCEMVITYKK